MTVERVVLLLFGSLCLLIPSCGGGGDGDSDVDSDVDSEVDSDADSDTDTEADSDADQDGDVVEDAEVEGDAEVDTDSDTDTDVPPDEPPQPLIIIALDAFHPGYLELNAAGEAGGRPGDYLLPNLHEFLAQATLLEDARDYLPSATDMNHLNAFAGTSSGQTGVLGVSLQIIGWNADRTPIVEPVHISWATNGRGEPVDTLFHAWQRRYPSSQLALVSGKGWMGEMFREEGGPIDLIVTGADHPAYIPAPTAHNFADPEADEDAECDPESTIQQVFLEVMAANPESVPSDAWVADATLAVLEREQPDLTFVLLAQTDDAQHILGAAWDPEEFVECEPPYIPPSGCLRDRDPAWQLVSRRNPYVYREPVLDALRDVDRAFGRLIEGLRALERYREATVVVYSDHGQVTHLRDAGWTDGQVTGEDTDLVAILRDAGLLSEEEAEAVGFAAGTATSVGELYWLADTPEERDARAAAAREVLLAHRARNPETGAMECPWDVLSRTEMRAGLPDVSVPGELWHEGFGGNPGPDPIVWPDLLIFARNGWQIPAYSGMLANLGVDIPVDLPLAIMLGGHGAADTSGILLAFSGPGVTPGRTLVDPAYERDYRIADIAVTAASMFDLTLENLSVGRDRTTELAAP
jgi:hypothetical protein